MELPRAAFAPLLYSNKALSETFHRRKRYKHFKRDVAGRDIFFLWGGREDINMVPSQRPDSKVSVTLNRLETREISAFQ